MRSVDDGFSALAGGHTDGSVRLFTSRVERSRCGGAGSGTHEDKAAELGGGTRIIWRDVRTWRSLPASRGLVAHTRQHGSREESGRATGTVSMCSQPKLESMGKDDLCTCSINSFCLVKYVRIIEGRAITPDSSTSVLLYVGWQGILREHVSHDSQPTKSDVLP